MEEEKITVQMNSEMDVPHKFAPIESNRKVLGVHAGDVMLEKVREISQLLWHASSEDQADVNVKIATAL